MKKRKDGRYVKKITLPDGQKKFVYGKSPHEVTQKERELLKEYESGVVVGDETTVGQWAEVWFETYKGELRYKTKEVYLNAYNNHILPHIGNMKLRDVRAVHIQQIMNNVAERSESLQAKIIGTARQMFQAAINNRLISIDPSSGIRIKKHTKSDRIKHLTEEQWRLLLRRTLGLPVHLFCSICIFTGLRREEVLGLQWGDIYEDKIVVRRAITFTKNQPDDNHSLKSKAANREVPMMDELRDTLSQQSKRHLYLFTRASGEPMSKIAFKRMWEHVDRVVDFKVTPHMLRHTYATILYNAGVDLKTAQGLLGHSDIRMTANIYTHIEKGHTLKAASKIQNFISGSQVGSQNEENA